MNDEITRESGSLGRDDVSPSAVLERAERRRADLLGVLQPHHASLPLRYRRQQAHFTTPGDDESKARKAIEGGTEPVRRLLDRYAISADLLASRLDLPSDTVQEALARPRRAPLVVLDGEDAQAPGDNVAARGRDSVVRLLREADWGGADGAGTLRFYRPSGLSLPSAAQDLVHVLLGAGQGRDAGDYALDGIVYPKIERPEDVDWVMATLDDVEASLRLDPGRIRLALLVESGWCVARLGEIVRRAAPRLCAIILGLADYAADLGLPAIDNRHPVADWARAAVVNAAGAVGVPAIDAMTLDYPVADPGLDRAANRERFLTRVARVYRDALHACQMGMTGKWVGHPAQLFAALLAFDQMYSPESLDEAVRKLAAYQAAVRDERGATIIDGAMADRATDRHLRMRLRQAVALGHVSVEQARAWGVLDASESVAPGTAWT